jgi:hypothetical protein
MGTVENFISQLHESGFQEVTTPCLIPLQPFFGLTASLSKFPTKGSQAKKSAAAGRTGRDKTALSPADWCPCPSLGSWWGTGPHAGCSN